MALADTVVETILKSPLHRVMSGSMILVRSRESGTGDESTIAVQYADAHHGLVVMVDKAEQNSWWRNFTDMGQVQVLVGGDWIPMTAHALVGADDPDAVTPLVRSYAARFPKIANSLDGENLEERIADAVVVWLRPVTG